MRPLVARMMCLATLTLVGLGCACKSSNSSNTPDMEATVNRSPPDAQQMFTGEGCARTGCSGHICAPAGEPVVSTCVWREEYACYKSARCEKQPQGTCGWTPSAELSSCIEAAKSAP